MGSTGFETHATDLYALVEENFDELEQVWDERYERSYGFWRLSIPIIRSEADSARTGE